MHHIKEVNNRVQIKEVFHIILTWTEDLILIFVFRNEFFFFACVNLKICSSHLV